MQLHFGFFYVHFEGNTKNICKYFWVDNLFIGNRLIDIREQNSSLIMWLLITFSSSIGLIIVSLQSENQTKGVYNEENFEKTTDHKRGQCNAGILRHPQGHPGKSPARYKKRLTDGFITLTHANYQPTAKNTPQPPKRPLKRDIRQSLQHAVVETSPGAGIEERPVFVPTMPRKRDSETSRASPPHHASFNLC